ncbi:hypothetical protein MTO96_020169 [Rhipicephalus appendiculatus]
MRIRANACCSRSYRETEIERHENLACVELSAASDEEGRWFTSSRPYEDVAQRPSSTLTGYLYEEPVYHLDCTIESSGRRKLLQMQFCSYVNARPDLREEGNRRGWASKGGVLWHTPRLLYIHSRMRRALAPVPVVPCSWPLARRNARKECRGQRLLLIDNTSSKHCF